MGIHLCKKDTTPILAAVTGCSSMSRCLFGQGRLTGHFTGRSTIVNNEDPFLNSDYKLYVS
jgi:hypothetical protein